MFNKLCLAHDMFLPIVPEETSSLFSRCLLVSEGDTFGLFILPSRCKVELLISPSARSVLPPHSLSSLFLSVYSSSIILGFNFEEEADKLDGRMKDMNRRGLTHYLRRWWDIIGSSRPPFESFERRTRGWRQWRVTAAGEPEEETGGHVTQWK